MQTQKYQRKSFLVDAVQVTEENMEEVAKWCRGTIRTTDSKIAEGLHKEPERYIEVNVLNPYNDRQKQAFPGDWVLFSKNNFKVYLDKGFHKVFEAVFKEQEKAAAPYQGNVVSEKPEQAEEAKDETPVVPTPVPTPPPVRMTVND